MVIFFGYDKPVQQNMSQTEEDANEWEQAALLLAQLQESMLLCDAVAFQAMLNVCRDGGQCHGAVEMLADLRRLVGQLI